MMKGLLGVVSPRSYFPLSDFSTQAQPPAQFTSPRASRLQPGFLTTLFRFHSGDRKGAAKGSVSKPLRSVIPIRQPKERNLALSIFNAVQDSSPSATKNGGLLGITFKPGSHADS